MTKKELLKYLTDCKELELTLYNMEKEQEKLRRNMSQLGIANNYYMPDKDRIEKEHEYDNGCIREVAPVVATIITAIVLAIIGDLSGLSGSGFVILWIICVIASLFAWFFVIRKTSYSLIIKPKVNNEFGIAMQQYNLAVQSDQARVAGENKQKQIIQSRIDNIEYQRNETKGALDKLYAVGIVYPKYHALIPIVMFCEYLESGRCEELEGHEGAYNIYENELRQNIIIAKLDVVVNQLDQIKQNQYMLADAIERGNRQIERLCNATMESAARLENIQQNQAIIAENARISANNTYVIGQLEAYRLMSGK